MDESGATEVDDAEDGRIVDRSGDIDQRPPEEKGFQAIGSIVAFRGSAATPARSRPAIETPVAAAPLPAARSNAPSQDLAAVAQRLQKDLDKLHAKSKARLEAAVQKIEAQERRCTPPKLDEDLQQIRFERQKVMVANGPQLADNLRLEKARLADLQHFKADNRIVREAHYPSSPVLSFAILTAVILIEACINAVLFADASEQGFLGGWLEAIVLALTNSGTAFLFGRLALPQLHRRGVGWRAFGVAMIVLGAGAIIAINLAGAHYRDFKSGLSDVQRQAKTGTISTPESAPPIPNPKAAPATPHLQRPGKASASEPPAAPAQQPMTQEKAAPAERDAIAQAIQAPLALRSFSSLFLLVIGLCGAIIAAWDGYKFDDPFPGYGKRHRRYTEARARSADALRRILNQSNAIMASTFQGVGRKIETYAHELGTLQGLHHVYFGDLKGFQDALDDAAREAEDELAYHERLLKRTGDRNAAASFALGTKPLPPLAEKHLRFAESNERKLKALQKSAQKEQNDVLGLFETAAADFHRLLAEVSHSSLEAALGTRTIAEPNSASIP